MAYHAPITTRRGALALLGATPLMAIPVDTRPTSFADALRQYHKAAFARSAIRPVDEAAEFAYDLAQSDVLDALESLTQTPAGTVSDATAKLSAIRREFMDGNIYPEHIDALLADLVLIGNHS